MIFYFFFIIMLIIRWNCQGKGSIVFKTVANNLIITYKPMTFVMVEPRISTPKANKVIKSLSMPCFHCI